MKLTSVFGGYFLYDEMLYKQFVYLMTYQLWLEYHYVVTTIPVSYLTGPGFISHPGGCLFGLRFFMVFLSNSGFQAYVYIGHGSFLLSHTLF